LLCALALSATMVQAQPASPPNAPPANLSCPGPALAPVTEPPADREGQPVVIYAEQLQGSPNRPGEATGRVELFRADQFMATERVLVDPRTSVVTLPGPVRYQDANVRLESSGGQYGFLTESGTFEDVRAGNRAAPRRRRRRRRGRQARAGRGAGALGALVHLPDR
jgi:LPS-assembly protein